MSQIVTVAYSPNDFFYNTSSMMPRDNECKTMIKSKVYWDDKCCIDKSDKSSCTTWNDNSGNCYKYELCKNKMYSALANKMQNSNSGSDERVANIKKQYEYAILNTVNLTSGIAVILYLSFYYFT